MLAKDSDLFDAIHVNPKATEETLDRGTIVGVQRSNRSFAMFVVDNPDVARSLFKAKPSDTVGVIHDNPSRFGLRLIFVDNLPEPHKTKWTNEFRGKR